MKQRPPRKKKRLDLPGEAYQALKKSEKSLSLKELYSLIEKSLTDKYDLSLSALHTELNVDGRFVFLSDRTWALKSRVPNLKRKPLEELDLLEVEYQPAKEDYKWNKNKDEDDVADDESELLVPYDGEEMELVDGDESPEDDDNDFDEDSDDDYPE